MHYARQGVVTAEMAFVAARENMPVDFIVSEVSKTLLIHLNRIEMYGIRVCDVGRAFFRRLRTDLGANCFKTASNAVRR